jgi:hypothetical protein
MKNNATTMHIRYILVVLSNTEGNNSGLLDVSRQALEVFNYARLKVYIEILVFDFFK